MHIRSFTPDWVAFAAMGIFAAAALYCAWTDIDRMIIPNKVTYPLILFFMVSAPLLWKDWGTHLICGFAVSLFFFILANIPVRGGYAMGMGDVKMYSAVGFAFGLGSLLCIVIATLFGTVIGTFILIKKGRSEHIPHGPHITAAILIMIALGIQGVLS